MNIVINYFLSKISKCLNSVNIKIAQLYGSFKSGKSKSFLIKVISKESLVSSVSI